MLGKTKPSASYPTSQMSHHSKSNAHTKQDHNEDFDAMSSHRRRCSLTCEGSLHLQVFIISIVLSLLTVQTSSYLIVVNETVDPGTVIFNASVYKLGSERHYEINAHKSAHFVDHLVEVNHKDGRIMLKKHLKCDGIYYPNLFTFYVDSTSNRLRSIDYYSLPIRIFVAGNDCNDDRRIEMYGRLFEEEDTGYSKRRRRRYIQNEDETDERFYGEYVGHNFLEFNHNDSRKFQDGDLIFGDSFDNEMRHRILSRKRRSRDFDSDVGSMHRRVADAKQWISETYASYAIHTTDK